MAKKDIVAYPAVFEKDDSINGYGIFFPDVPGALSQSKTIPEGIIGAADALALTIYDEKDRPYATPIDKVRADYQNDDVELIAVDMVEAVKHMEAPLVKKNTTIPAKLATEASDRGINFSAVLTRALEKELEK